MGLDDDDLIAAAEARERAAATPAKDASMAYVRAMTTRFDGGAPVRVVFSDTMRGANAAQHLGVVVETSGGASMDALVFRVDVDEATCVGSCSLHETRSSPSQRATRRRSSIGATASAASAPPSPDAVRVSPNGRFVFAAHAEDGVRLLAVRDGDAPASKNTSTSSDVVKHLGCGFKVTRVATTMGESGFLLAAAGEPGRCVVWSWSVNDANDDEFLLKEHVTCDEMPAMNYRGVVPKPGTSHESAVARRRSQSKNRRRRRRRFDLRVERLGEGARSLVVRDRPRHSIIDSGSLRRRAIAWPRRRRALGRSGARASQARAAFGSRVERLLRRLSVERARRIVRDRRRTHSCSRFIHRRVVIRLGVVHGGIVGVRGRRRVLRRARRRVRRLEHSHRRVRAQGAARRTGKW